jgi:hypothetical protein
MADQSGRESLKDAKLSTAQQPTEIWEIRYLQRRKVVATDVFRGSWDDALAFAQSTEHPDVNTYQISALKAAKQNDDDS